MGCLLITNLTDELNENSQTGAYSPVMSDKSKNDNDYLV